MGATTGWISRGTRASRLLVSLCLLAGLFVSAPAAQAQVQEPVPAASLDHRCTNGSGVIEFTLVGGAGGTTFTYRVAGLEDRQVAVEQGESVVVRRSGRSDGIAYAASVLVDGVAMLSESVRIRCSIAPVPVSTVVVGTCVDGVGRISIELANGSPDAVDYSVGVLGLQVAPLVGSLEPLASATLVRSGRADGVYQVVAALGAASETWPIEIACQIDAPLGASISSYCLESGGVIAVDLDAAEMPVKITVQVSGLDDRIVELAARESTTTLRTGRPDGSYEVVAQIDGEVLAAETIEVDCVENPPVTINASTDCVAGAGRVIVELKNTDTAVAAFSVQVVGVSAPPLTGEVQPGTSETVYRTGRPDGTWVVLTTIDGGPAHRDEVTVDCIAPDVAPKVQVNFECAPGGDGTIVFTIEGGSYRAAVTVLVAGLASRVVDVPAGEITRSYVSGRPDGSYEVTVSEGGAVLVNTTIDIDCDPDPGDVGLFVEVSCVAGVGVITMTLQNGGAFDVAYLLTLAGAEVAPFEGVLAPGEGESFRRTGRREGAHVVVATVAGAVREYPVIVECAGQPDTPRPTPTPVGSGLVVPGPGGASADLIGFTGAGIEDVTVTYDVTLAGPAVADSLASPVYEFQLNDPGDQFQSARLTLPYYPALLNGAAPSTLQIYTYNEIFGLWVLVEGQQQVDAVAHTVSVDVSHFSKYAVFNLGVEGFAKYWQTKPVFCVAPGQDPNSGLDIAFVIDTSGSMRNNDPSGLRVDAALDIVDRASTSDRIAVVGFSAGARVEAELTEASATNLTTIRSALEDTRRASGGTSITSAVQTATSVLTSDVISGRPRIAILLTDGISSYNEAATMAAADENVLIYTVALGTNVDVPLLRAIAEGTGGRFLQADNASQIAAIYDDIASGLIDDNSDDDGDGLTNCEERRGMYTTDGFYFTLPNILGGDGSTVFIPTPRTMTSDPTLTDTDGDGVDDNVEMGPALDLRTVPQVAATYSFLIDAGITRIYNPISNPRVKDNPPPPAPGSIVPVPSRSWAVPTGVGIATAGKAGVVSAGGALLTGGIVAELIVQYFQTFDLDPLFRETYTVHLLPMIADLPGDDLDLQVTTYEALPWVEPATKPYRDDPRECLAWTPAIGGGMQSFRSRRDTNPNISGEATLAVAIYCIDEKIGGAAARSGGPNAVPPDMPGLSVNPDAAEQRLAFDGTPQNHAETNVLGSLISGVPIQTTSIGVIYMLVDNPASGRICGFCLEAFEAFKRRYPGVSLTVRARNNAWQDGNYIDQVANTDIYDDEVSGG